MKKQKLHDKIRFGDVTFVVLALCMTGGGYFLALTHEVSLSEKMIYLIPLQMMFFAWTTSGTSKRCGRQVALGCALKIQIQSIVELFIAGYFLALSAAFVYLAYVSQYQADLLLKEIASWREQVVPVCFSFSYGLIVTGILIAALRMHWLKRKNVSLEDVYHSKIEKLQYFILDETPNILERLEWYLGDLNSPKKPNFYRSIYGRRPTIKKVDGQNCNGYDILFSSCPSKMRISVSRTEGKSIIDVEVSLRSWVFKLYLFPNPIDVVTLIMYADANVISPLMAEFTAGAARKKQEELRQAALEMQLRVLQAQIEPHFLFNTLATLRHVYRTSLDDGEKMMNHLIGYLRNTMEELRSDSSTVSKELDLALHYLAIMRIRLGDRLSYSFEQPEEISHAFFPPAMLISLVENAIIHGVRNIASGNVRVSALAEAGCIRVTVTDNGPGFSSAQGTGVGLSNIQQRLEAMYGNQAWLEVGALQEGGFMASIVVPIASKST
ncbi:hypothetical protein GTP58_20140 [Duganella sp. CY15W]|uniref:sensor histidine kinase n=1 Tax=Duganella sp. CY15W TaxID=2692172 RepID=UPI00136CCB56|nr:histidine kinase [Duganella sp. CY15W]MYM30646.1 hypothetical protein [Duganella sp. CY15W]